MLTLEKVIEDMKACNQTEGQTIYQHGESVRDFSLSIVSGLSSGSFDKL